MLLLKLDAATFLDSILTEEIRVLSGKYSRAIAGIPEASSKRKSSLINWQKYHYSQALGLWYAGEKFSPEAKADVKLK